MPGMATRNFVTFLVVSMNPQQSPGSPIWPHIATKSGGGISSVNFAFPRSRWAEVLKWPPLNSTSRSSATSLHSPESSFCNSSPVRSRVAQMNREVRCTCIVHAWAPPGSKVMSSALVVVKLFRCNFCDLMEVRLCFLEQNHMIRAEPAVRDVTLLLCKPALQHRIERRVWSLSASPNLLGHDPLNGRKSFTCLYFGCKSLPSFAVTPVLHPCETGLRPRIFTCFLRGSGASLFLPFRSTRRTQRLA